MGRDPSLNLAKISAPAPVDIVRRRRLHRVLDAAQARPLTWVCGLAGCGKTIFVADYVRANKRPCLWYQVDAGDGDPASAFHFLGLAARKAAPRSRRPLPPRFGPEHLPGIRVFSRRFFRDLFARLEAGSIVVFDNVQDAPQDSPFLDVLREGLEEVPSGMCAILISRSDPPPIFSRFRAARSLSYIGWDELRFTEEEALRLLGRLDDTPGSGRHLHHVIEAAGGWAAGLVLMAGRTPGDRTRLRGTRIEAFEGVFDYFATEVFSTIARSTQLFLLKTAFLPSTTPAAAKALTDHPRSREILKDLADRNFFTVRRPDDRVYEYHPLFRRFLRERANRSFDRDELRTLKRSAAALLEGGGQISEAVDLLVEIEDWEGLFRVIEPHVVEFLGKSRHTTVRSWLSEVPEDVLERNPWFLYWRGAAETFGNPSEAHSALLRAYRRFRNDGDSAGAFLTWSSVANLLSHSQQYGAEFESWLDEFEDLSAAHPDYPSPDIECQVAASMATALGYHRVWDPSLHRWSERAAILAEQAGNPDLQCHALLQRLHAFVLDVCNPERSRVHEAILSMLDRFAISDFMKLQERLFANADCCYGGRHRECLDAGAETLAFAERAGIFVYHPLILYWMGLSSLNSGDARSARQTIERMTPFVQGGFEAFQYYQNLLRASDRYLSNDLRGAADPVLASLEGIGEGGATLVHILIRSLATHVFSNLGDAVEARRHLAVVRTFAERTGNPIVMHNALLCEAEIALDQGDEAGALAPLRAGLSLGRDLPMNYALTWHPSRLARLCALALGHEIEVETALRIVRARGLRFDQPARFRETWPWPIRVETLGGFAVYRNDERIAFVRRAPRKPLDLLKALIAFGGSGVSVDRLTDALWPEAEGDAGVHAFETALYRLRRLLGVEGVLALSQGQLTLSPDLCWVDLWAFETLLAEATASLKRGAGAESVGDIEHFEQAALRLYRGAFLDGPADAPWAEPARRDAATRMCRLLWALGGEWERHRKPERAAQCYERGSSLDNASEASRQQNLSALDRLARADGRAG